MLESRYKNHPKKWWSAFHQFQREVDDVAKQGKYTRPNIWLSEQGVQYFSGEKPELPWTKPGAANEVMNAFVDHGAGQLTRQLNANKELQITRFLYNSTRGAPAFDSGLLEAQTLPKNSKNEELIHQKKADTPRSIYYIYRAKTPGGAYKK